MSGERRSFYVVGVDPSVTRLIENVGHTLAETEEDADGVIFTGGEDISSFLYGEKRLPCTRPNFVRDLEEVAVVKSLPHDKPKIGICRGGQLLNVLSGGSMIQDVDNHWIQGKHDVKDLATGQLIGVRSLHHQMMHPATNALIIAVSKESTRKQTARMKISLKSNDWEDPEILYYPHTNSFCFQGHPEYTPKGDPSQEYFWDLVEKYCFQ